MSDNQPTDWQWRTPQDGKIDGLTRKQWMARGVALWACRRSGVIVQILPINDEEKFAFMSGLERQYAPASLDGLPAAWPAKMDWQWRRLEADMDKSTWRAVPRWHCAGKGQEPVPAEAGAWFNGRCTVAAERSEWWAPADEDGNPCEWPEVESQAVVVIPAADMTPLVLYGHQAMGGTWRWRDPGEDDWNDGEEYTYGFIDDNEQWTPCDEHGDFCELRLVVSSHEDAIHAEGEAAAERAMHDARRRVEFWQRRCREAHEELDEWKRRAEKAVRHVRELEEAIHYAYRAMACAEANE